MITFEMYLTCDECGRNHHVDHSPFVLIQEIQATNRRMTLTTPEGVWAVHPGRITYCFKCEAAYRAAQRDPLQRQYYEE